MYIYPVDVIARQKLSSLSNSHLAISQVTVAASQVTEDVNPT